MLPVVVTYNLAAAVASNVVNALGTTGGLLTLVSTPVTLDTQRRLLITAVGNESSNTFTVIGLNQAGFTISEVIIGPNATTTQSNLDFKTVISVRALATTAGTLSIGTDGQGSSLWNIVNWHVSPSNIEYGCVLQSGVATFSIQYTYDDPNNLPTGVTYPQPFNHPTIVAATTSIDGASNDPITAWRLLITAGTGTVRAIGIQAGIAGP